MNLLGSQYEPLDELLELPIVRILRLLSRADALTSTEIFDVLGIVTTDDDCRERDRYAKILERLVKRGAATATGTRNCQQYAITDVGRALLAQGFAARDVGNGESKSRKRRTAKTMASGGDRNAESREYQATKYAARKAAGLCVRCGAGLQEDDGIYCVECTEARRVEQARYRTGENARRLHLAAMKRGYYRDPEKLRRRKREDRERRKLAGICYSCLLPALEDSCFCHKHREVNRAASRRQAAKRSRRLRIQRRLDKRAARIAARRAA